MACSYSGLPHVHGRDWLGLQDLGNLWVNAENSIPRSPFLITAMARMEKETQVNNRNLHFTQLFGKDVQLPGTSLRLGVHIDIKGIIVYLGKEL